MSIQHFQNSSLGTYVEFLGETESGESVFTLSPVAKALGYRDAANALRVLDEDEYLSEGDSLYNTHLVSIWRDQHKRGRLPVLVTESGLYHLTFKSTKPEAKRFRKWVTEEVLPSIRRDGAYVSPDITPQQSIRLLEKIDYKAVLDALASANGYENLAPKTFANMQNGFYKVVIGTTAADFKRRRGLPSRAVVKDYLNDEELSRLQGLSMVLIGKLRVAYPDGVYDVDEFADTFFKVIQTEFEHRPVLH